MWIYLIVCIYKVYVETIETEAVFLKIKKVIPAIFLLVRASQKFLFWFALELFQQISFNVIYI